ncbi:MAG: phosphatase PAP2 family protein [Candidatus Rhabdochlamydia sp.]
MKFKSLALSFLIIFALYASFLTPATRQLWDVLDATCFRFLNTYCLSTPSLQYFWAAINHKYMDFVEDGIFLLFFTLSVWQTPSSLKKKKIAQFIFSVLLGACTIFFINKQLLRSYAVFPRQSPSLTLAPCIRISELISWELLKDSTWVSFPGDHATLLLLFAILYSAFATFRLSCIAWAYALFRILPRLIVGAHWLSDIAVGSGSIALFATAIFLYTPLSLKVIDWIEKYLPNNDHEVNYDYEKTVS